MKMKSKKMKMECEDECCRQEMAGCDHGRACHPKGKALLAIGMGTTLIAFSLGIATWEVAIGMVGALLVLKGAVKFWEAKCHC